MSDPQSIAADPESYVPAGDPEELSYSDLMADYLLSQAPEKGAPPAPTSSGGAT